MIQEIDGIGDFKFIDYMKDGEGIRTLRKFLKEVTIKQADYSLNYIKHVGIPPFSYKEKQLHTVMAPAISDISDAYLMESSVARKWTSINNDMDDSHGWVDYWCLYKIIIIILNLNTASYHIGVLKYGSLLKMNGKLLVIN